VIRGDAHGWRGSRTDLMPPRPIEQAAALRARRRLAAWISEHGRPDSATCDLLDVLDDLDKALDVGER
jgi:hypothetical protein